MNWNNKMCIVIIEDTPHDLAGIIAGLIPKMSNDAFIMRMRKKVAEEFFHIIKADTIDAAFEKLDGQEPDLWIIDINLPVSTYGPGFKDGLELYHWLGSVYEGCVRVLVTSHSDQYPEELTENVMADLVVKAKDGGHRSLYIRSKRILNRVAIRIVSKIDANSRKKIINKLTPKKAGFKDIQKLTLKLGERKIELDQVFAYNIILSGAADDPEPVNQTDRSEVLAMLRLPNAPLERKLNAVYSTASMRSFIEHYENDLYATRELLVTRRVEQVIEDLLRNIDKPAHLRLIEHDLSFRIEDKKYKTDLHEQQDFIDRFTNVQVLRRTLLFFEIFFQREVDVNLKNILGKSQLNFYQEVIHHIIQAAHQMVKDDERTYFKADSRNLNLGFNQKLKHARERVSLEYYNMQIEDEWFESQYEHNARIAKKLILK